MTSEEIKTRDLPPSDNIEFVYVIEWLKEIAYQLAVGNEQRERSIHDELAREYLKGVAHGRSDSLAAPVRAGSGSEVRGEERPYYLVVRDLQEAHWLLAEVLRPGSIQNLHDWVVWSRLIQAFLRRTSDERTTHPNPQTSSIQHQEKP